MAVTTPNAKKNPAGVRHLSTPDILAAMMTDSDDDEPAALRAREELKATRTAWDDEEKENPKSPKSPKSPLGKRGDGRGRDARVSSPTKNPLRSLLMNVNRGRDDRGADASSAAAASVVAETFDLRDDEVDRAKQLEVRHHESLKTHGMKPLAPPSRAAAETLAMTSRRRGDASAAIAATASHLAFFALAACWLFVVAVFIDVHGLWLPYYPNAFAVCTDGPRDVVRGAVSLARFMTGVAETPAKVAETGWRAWLSFFWPR